MRESAAFTLRRFGTFVETLASMEDLLVTCPETGRREQIGGLVARDHELLVVLRCTRFDPPEAVTCSTSCVHCASRRTAADPWRLPAPDVAG
jgi:hypothetical protein